MIRWIRHSAILAVALVAAGCQATAPQVARTDAAPASVTTPAAQPAPLDFRLAQDQAAPGLSALAIGGRTLWILPQPVLTRQAVAGIAPIQDAQGRPYVRFDFTEAERQRLAAITRANRGASLVITVGDTVVAAPRIGDPITQGVLNLPVADVATAQAIVNAVVGG